MTFHVITIFPEIFDSYFKYGVLGHAIKKKKVKIKIYDLRDFADDKRRTVDDTVYGGGAGMLLKIEPIYRCIQKIQKSFKVRPFPSPTSRGIPQGQTFPRVILFSAKGKKYTQADARRIAKYDNLILICGRYEGVDERVAKFIADEEISMGEYILTGGEIPAMIVVDSISRITPGVLGNEDSFKGESFYKKGYLEYPQYTKPADFRGWKVPEVLLSGDHKKIKNWREKNSKKLK